MFPIVARPPTSAVEARKVIPARRSAGLLLILALSVRVLRPTVLTAASSVERELFLRLFTDREETFTEREASTFLVCPRSTTRAERFFTVLFSVFCSTFSFEFFVGIARDIAEVAAKAFAVAKRPMKIHKETFFISRS